MSGYHFHKQDFIDFYKIFKTDHVLVQGQPQKSIHKCSQRYIVFQATGASLIRRIKEIYSSNEIWKNIAFEIKIPNKIPELHQIKKG